MCRDLQIAIRMVLEAAGDFVVVMADGQDDDLKSLARQLGHQSQQQVADRVGTGDGRRR